MSEPIFSLPPFESGPSFESRSLAPANWGMAACFLDDLRALGLTGEGVEVAVLDTGIDTDHPEFTGRIIEAESFIPGESVEDGNGHGTHCAGTIGASTPSVGVAPKVKLRIYKVLSNAGSGATSGITRAVQLATQRRVPVMSASIGGGGVDRSLSDALAAYVASGGVFLAAAGNSRPNRWEFPGNDPSSLAVAAYNRSGQVTNFSSIGDTATSLATGAPGQDIVSARAGGGYVSMSGTSMATPFAAGVAALVVEWFRIVGRPTPSSAWFRNLFRNYNTDAGVPGLDRDLGPGLISGRAIRRALTAPPTEG